VKEFPFIRFAVLFVLGIVLSKYLNVESFIYLITIIVLIVIQILLFWFAYSYSNKIISTILVSFVIILLGGFIFTQNNSELKSPLLEYQKEKDVKLYADILEVELSRSFEIVFTIKTDSIKFDNKLIVLNDKLICKFRGDSLQRKNIYSIINPGNKIFLTGTFQKGRERRNPAEFDYDQFLKSQGISGLFISYDTDSINITDNRKRQFESELFWIRKQIDNLIHNLHSSETAGLLRGLLLADRSEIDYDTKSAFINSGVIHILAVSGLHVGYVLVIFIFLFGRFGIYTRSILTIIGLLTFMFITGIPPSVFRATLMAVLLIIAFLFNRSTNLINSIAIAAVIILLLNPAEVFNPGFQLSFSAVLSIGIIYPYIQNLISKLKLKHRWIEYILLFLGVSISAQLGTLPFTLVYFSKLSVIALLTNLFVIPVVGVIISVAFITILIGSFAPWIGIYFASANDLISNIMMNFISYTGTLDISFLWIRDYTIYDALIFYFGLGFLLVFLKLIEKTYLKFIIILLMFISIFVYSEFDNKVLLEDKKFYVMMIDVGQGDALLIKFPNGKTALIDAGEANPFIDNGEKIITPLLDYFGIDIIDYGFISHLDLDHYGGFVSLIYNNKINEVYRPLPDSSSKSRRLEKFLAAKNVKTNIYDRTSLKIGNVEMFILNNPYDYSYRSFSGNNKSGILKLVYGKTSFLFMGDAEFPAENYLLSNFSGMLDSDVLKVGHHGSPTGSSQAFINLVSPKISLISAGIKNKFSHPAESVLKILSSVNSDIYRTDLLGAVLLQSDGEEIKAINWK
jgi:competence protein ComEC